MTTTKRAPANLGSAGRSLWREVCEVWTLRPDEYRVLENACRELDLIARLEDELAASSITVKGSHNQPVINGVVTEIRQHRAVFTSLMRFLALPDSEDRQAQKVNDRSEQMRQLANIRHHGNPGGRSSHGQDRSHGQDSGAVPPRDRKDRSRGAA